MPEGVSDVNSKTYRICDYIDYYLQPVATQHASYINDFVDTISNTEINTS